MVLLHHCSLLIALIAGIDISVLSGVSLSDYSVQYGLAHEIDFNRTSGAQTLNLQSGFLFDNGIHLGMEFETFLSPLEWKAESELFTRIGSVREDELAATCSYIVDASRINPFIGGGIGLNWGSYSYEYISDSLTFENDDGLNSSICFKLFCGAEIPVSRIISASCRASYDYVPRNDFPGWLVQDTNYMNSFGFLIGLGIRP